MRPIRATAIDLYHCSNEPLTMNLRAYQITTGTVQVVILGTHLASGEVTLPLPISVVYDPTDDVFYVRSSSHYLCTPNFTHHTVPATRRALCGYVGRINFRIYDDFDKPDDLDDTLQSLSDEPARKLLLISFIARNVKEDGTLVPEWPPEWHEETLQALAAQQYWFQVRPLYESAPYGVNLDIPPLERFLGVKDRLDSNHFLPPL